MCSILLTFSVCVVGLLFRQVLCVAQNENADALSWLFIEEEAVDVSSPPLSSTTRRGGRCYESTPTLQPS